MRLQIEKRSNTPVAPYSANTLYLISGSNSLLHIMLTDSSGSVAYKSISTADVSAVVDAVLMVQKGASNGIASLDGDALVPRAQLPDFIKEVGQFSSLPVTGQSGVLYVTLNDNKPYIWNGAAYIGVISNVGTVTSVALNLPSMFTVTGSPVTGSGTLTATLASQTAKTFLAAPNAAAGAPSFRAIVASDIPTLNQSTTGSAATLTTGRTVGMTGDVTWTSASFNGSANVTGTATLANSGVVAGTYTKVTVDAKGRVTTGTLLIASDIPTLNQSTTGTASNVTGTVAIANGGTGATTAAAARTNLGATTVGGNLFTMSNVVSISFPRINADNTVSTLDAATFRTAIGAGTSSTIGTVTSIGGTGTVSGLSLSGTVTTSGNLTLSGTLSVLPSNFASQTAATVLAAPSGVAGVPTFRTLVASDIPALNQSTTGSAATLTTTRVISIIGDAAWSVSFNGSANATASLTLANTAVTAGTYNNSATAITPLTVDSKGRITGTGAAVTITPAWSSITGKPTTVATSGITDVYTKAETDTLLNAKENTSNKGAINGYASLDATGRVPSTQLPSFVDDVLEFANFAALPVTGESGKIYVLATPYTDGGITSSQYRWSGTAYAAIIASPGTTDAVTEGSTNLYFTTARAASAAPVQSVAGKTGDVTLVRADVGLDNVNNTSDANKPISTATSTALSGKENSIASGTVSQYWSGLKTWRDFFSEVRGTTLTGLSTATNSAVVAADTALVGVGKLQAQITGHIGTGGASHAVVVAGGNAGFMSGADKTKLDNIATGATANTGTVTSVGLSLPNIFSITSSPVTDSGTLTATLASQTAKFVLAAPNAANGTPSFRALVASDIPLLNQNTTGSAATLATARKINNVAFDGSADIVIPSVYDSSFTRIVNPGGAVFNSGSVSVTGALRITLPVGFVSSMIQIDVKVYNYSSQSFDIHLDGYLYATGPTWHGAKAYLTGPKNVNANYPIRFGMTSGNIPVVYIGNTNTVWSYPKAYVTLVTVGYIGQSLTWTSGWSIDVVTALETVQITELNPQLGYAVSTNTANSYVLRDITGSFSAGTITASLAGNASTTTALQNGRTIGMTGDVTWTTPAFDGSANVTATATLADSGIPAGTYNDNATTVRPFTIDAKGRVTAAPSAITITPAWSNITSKPTTISGYAISDAYTKTEVDSALGAKQDTIVAGTSAQYYRGDKTWQDLYTQVRNATLTGLSTATNAAITAADTVLAALGKFQAQITGHIGSTGSAHGVATTSVNGFMSTTDKAKLDGIATGATANTGTVTSVGLMVPSIMSVSGSPITTTGTFNISLVSQTANTFLAAPNAANGTPTFRTIVATDIPVLNQSTTGNAATASTLQNSRSITMTGDGSWTVSFNGGASVSSALTLASSGVIANTYNNSATAITPITVDAKGRITATGSAVTITPAWSSITGKPTTVATSGITDVYTKTETDTLLSAKENTSNKGAVNGYASLDATGKVPSTQLPSFVDDVLEYANYAALPATGESGKIYVLATPYTDGGITSSQYRWSGTAYAPIIASPGSTDAVTEGSVNLYFTTARAASAAPVQSVAGKTGAVTLVKADVGLSNVDDTSDANKPVSTAQQTALNLKENSVASGTTAQYYRGDKSWQDLFTQVRASTLTGLSTATNSAVAATDTVLVGVGKLQAQVTGHIGSGGASHANATTSVAGFMSGADKTKLDGIAAGATANTGTVTSVALSLPNIFTVSGSPVTTTGTLTATLASQTAGTVLAAPSGAAGVPTFRAIVASDIPTLNQSTTGSAATLTTGATIGMTGDVTWTSAIFNGSANVTGVSTLANSGVTAGTYTKVTVDAKGRVTTGASLVAGDVPVLNQNTTGSAATLTTARTINGVSFNGSSNIVVPTIYDQDFVRILNPQGAVFNHFSASVTGAIAITLPVGFTASMIQMTVKVYNYSGISFTVNIHGYLYQTGPTWHGARAYITSFKDMGVAYPVRFGMKAGNIPVIYIGDTTTAWSYPKAYVTEVYVGYVGQSLAWTTGWNIAMVTAFETVQITESSPLTDYSTSTNIAGAIVLRDVSGSFSAGIITASLSGNATTATALQNGRTIGMTGDVTWTSASFNGSANVTGTATLANSGVTAGTYGKVTVDAKGRVTAGTSLLASDIPTLNQNTTGTASNVTGVVAIANGGTGATTAAAARTNLGATTVGANLFTLNNVTNIRYIRINADNTITLQDASSFINNFDTGTVKSVGLSLPSIFTVSDSPVTTTGTLTATLASQTAGTVLAAPSGAAGVPTFRAIVASDIPTLNQNTTGSAVSISTTSAVDANLDRGSGIRVLTPTTGSTNFPIATGVTIETRRASGSSSANGTFQIFSDTSSSEIYSIRKVTGFTTVDTWSSWRTLVHSGNVGTFAPSLTGAGASGTWNIDINGNATSLGSVSSDNYVRGVNSVGVRTPSATQTLTEEAQYKAGFWDVSGAAWTPDTTWYWGATFAHRSNTNSYIYGSQLAFRQNTNTAYIRNINAGTVSSWSMLVTNDNISSLAVNLTTDQTKTAKLTLSPATVAWNQTAPGLTTGGLHLGSAGATAHSGHAITFGARDSGFGLTAQAGIYVVSDGSYGTKMYLGTSDLYLTGSKNAIEIDNKGDVTLLRGDLKLPNKEVVAKNFKHTKTLPTHRPLLLADFVNSKIINSRLQFIRASIATFFDGITQVMMEQNLCHNSEIFNGTDSQSTNTVVAPNAVVSPDGATTASTITASGGVSTQHHLGTLFPYVRSTATYTHSLFIKAGTTNFVQLFGHADMFGNNVWANFNLSNGTLGTVGSSTVASILDMGNGWYRCIITGTCIANTVTGSCFLVAPILTATDVRNPSYVQTGQSVHVWGRQVEMRDYASGYTKTTGVRITRYMSALVTAAQNVARLDYDPDTKEYLGYLSEGAATNMIANSENMTGYAKVNLNYIENYDIAPDGTKTANFCGQTTTSAIRYINTSVGTVLGNTYTYSLFVKSLGTPIVHVYMTNNVDGDVRIVFNFGTLAKTVTGNGSWTNPIGDVKAIGNGWYRIFISGTTGIGTSVAPILLQANSANQQAFVGNPYLGVLTWGWQLEAGNIMTSYIKTIGTTGNRSADVLKIKSNKVSSSINNDRATVHVVCKYLGGADKGTTFGRHALYMPAQNGWDNFRVYNASGFNSRILIQTNGVSTTMSSNTTFADDNFYSVAYSYSDTNFTTAISNITTSGVNTNLPHIVTEIFLGCTDDLGSNNLVGHIKKLAIYPESYDLNTVQTLSLEQ